MAANTLSYSGPVVATLGPMKCEAKHGRIVLHDERDGSVTHHFLDQFVHRVKAIKDHYDMAVASSGGYEFLLDEMPASHWRQFFLDADELLKIAALQTPVTDYQTRRERGPKKVSVLRAVQ